jgi:TonB family protein
VKVKEDPQPIPEPQQAAPPKEAPSPQLAADSDGPGDLSGKAGGEDYKGDGVVASTSAGGTGGGGGTYRAFVVSEFRRALLASERLRAMRFKRVPVRVTVSATGQIEKVDIVESTGKPEVDRLLVNLLQSVGRVSNPPPDGQAKTYSWLISPEV